MIDKNSPIPVYHQIEEWIKGKLERREWEEGETIPSERILAEQLEVSRMTVRQAVTNLVLKGFLYKEKGKGTFVKSRKIEQPLMELTSFSEDMAWRGYKAGNEVLRFEKVALKDSQAKKLKIEEEEDAFLLERIRLADEEPIAYERNLIPAYIFPNLTEEDLFASFYAYVEKQGYKIKGAEQSIEPSLARQHEAELLNIQLGDPVLLIRRVSYLNDGRPYEYVNSVYRGDKYKFITQMKRNK
jgi:GntR family transcriptional regulator